MDDRADAGDANAEPPRPKVARWAAIAVGVVLVLLIVVLATRKPQTDDSVSGALLGKRVPALAGTTLDGQQVSVDSFRGKFVVVNFLASWCVGCIQEHPDLLAFAREHPNDVQVIGVAFNDDPAELRSFFEKNGGDWPVITSDDGRAAIDFGVTAVPESFVVAPNQVVIAHAEGVTKEWLDDVVAQYETQVSNAPGVAPSSASSVPKAES